ILPVTALPPRDSGAAASGTGDGTGDAGGGQEDLVSAPGGAGLAGEPEGGHNIGDAAVGGGAVIQRHRRCGGGRQQRGGGGRGGEVLLHVLEARPPGDARRNSERWRCWWWFRGRQRGRCRRGNGLTSTHERYHDPRQPTAAQQ
ncbi:unnamed protein product, partial [Ectocarpus sp. 12 AP-2014]